MYDICKSCIIITLIIIATVCVLVFSCLLLYCFGNRGFMLAGIPGNTLLSCGTSNIIARRIYTGPFAQERHVPDERRFVENL